ncbi:hypothetical protein T439DRAFT_328942 [Meredithblackwellia eburnea MCA 4105]
MQSPSSTSNDHLFHQLHEEKMSKEKLNAFSKSVMDGRIALNPNALNELLVAHNVQYSEPLIPLNSITNSDIQVSLSNDGASSVGSPCSMPMSPPMSIPNSPASTSRASFGSSSSSTTAAIPMSRRRNSVRGFTPISSSSVTRSPIQHASESPSSPYIRPDPRAEAPSVPADFLLGDHYHSYENGKGGIDWHCMECAKVGGNTSKRGARKYGVYTTPSRDNISSIKRRAFQHLWSKHGKFSAHHVDDAVVVDESLFSSSNTTAMTIPRSAESTRSSSYTSSLSACSLFPDVASLSSSSSSSNIDFFQSLVGEDACTTDAAFVNSAANPWSSIEEPAIMPPTAPMDVSSHPLFNAPYPLSEEALFATFSPSLDPTMLDLDFLKAAHGLDWDPATAGLFGGDDLDVPFNFEL